MRFLGAERWGRGQRIALVDAGADLAGLRGHVRGHVLEVSASQHARVRTCAEAAHPLGTDLARLVLAGAPAAELLSLRVADSSRAAPAEALAAAIELAAQQGATVTIVTLGTPNMGRALWIREACALARSLGCVVVAAAHPLGERAYPADAPEVVSVASHPSCPPEHLYRFPPERFPEATWGRLSGRLLACGARTDAPDAPFQGPEAAAARVGARLACMREARPEASPEALIQTLHALARVAHPELGYA